MKRLLLTLTFAFSLATVLITTSHVLTGCTTSAQRTAFNTISSVETTTTAAVDGYFTLVIKGSLPTNGVSQVSKAYNKFQGGLLVALDLVQNNTNALAPSSLQQLSADVISLVGQFKLGH